MRKQIVNNLALKYCWSLAFLIYEVQHSRGYFIFPISLKLVLLFNVMSQRENDNQYLGTRGDLEHGGAAQSWKDWPGTHIGPSDGVATNWLGSYY